MTRDFDLSDILSVTDGRLVSDRHIEGVYDILNYMTGDNLFTHQLPRASRACEPVLLVQHPQLAGCGEGVEFDAEDIEDRKAQIEAWVDDMKARYGETLPVTPLDEWHRMNPIQELAEMTERPDRIIAAQVPEAPTS